MENHINATTLNPDYKRISMSVEDLAKPYIILLRVIDGQIEATDNKQKKKDLEAFFTATSKQMIIAINKYSPTIQNENDILKTFNLTEKP